MAAVDSFEITLTGQGGHGAMPEQTRDPLVAACHVVTALQTIVSRSTSPLDSCVVTVGKLEAGDSFNIIPHTARLSGTCRAFSKEAHDALPGRVREIVSGVASALGCRAEIDYRQICSPTVNEPLMTELMREVAREHFGADAVVTDGEGARTMAGEDFSALLEHRPGCFALVGSRNTAQGLTHPHHSPHFDFDEGALEVSVRLLEGIARRFLEVSR
jgi:amidohydrolase